MTEARISVRTGVFATSEGQRLLDDVLKNQTPRAEDVMSVFGALGGETTHTRDIHLVMQDTLRDQTHRGRAELEFAIMEQIRAMARVETRRQRVGAMTLRRDRRVARRAVPTPSVISETTDVASTFSREMW